MTIGERIKDIRTNKLKMSQVAFADKIDVSKQTLYKYENDIITNIPSDKIEAIAELGNVSPAYLMGWLDNESIQIVAKEPALDITKITKAINKNIPHAYADSILIEIVTDLLKEKFEKDEFEEFNQRVKERLPKDLGMPKQYTLAAHFNGDEYTEEELDEIKQFAEFVKNKRK